MSFRDENLYSREKRRGSNSNSNTTSTTINTTPTMDVPSLNMVRSLSVPITPPPSETAMDYQMSAPPAKKTRPITLHGKVLYLIDSDEMEDNVVTHKETLRMQLERTVSRQEQTAFERRNAFSNLTIETAQFQKLVTDLEGILEQSGESPEASWRARIMIGSAQEAEKDLWDKLSKYEQSPLAGTDTEHSQKELRSAQTACMKLHRDFNRSHKVLAMLLSLHQKRQKTEASGDSRAVRWSDEKDDTESTQQLNKKEKDFSDFRAMREREADLEREKKSLHKVNEIYYELGSASVDLDDNVLDEAATIHSGEDEFSCLFDRDPFCGAMNFSGMTDGIGGDSTERDGEEKQGNLISPPKVRNSEVFDWYMPFENIREDMKSVHRDIVGMSKDIIEKAKNTRARSSPSPLNLESR
jgi:hypothetical protein